MAAQQLNHPPAVLTKDMPSQALPNQPISQINADFMELINKDSSQGTIFKKASLFQSYSLTALFFSAIIR
jgi:hypothetical protein